MKKICITGVAGMLGANIAYLLKEKYKIYGIDKIHFQAQGIQCQQFDLLDFQRLEKSIYHIKPDYLIHTAALVSVDLCEQEKKLAKKLNSNLTSVLCQLCNAIGCHMIYISTDAVFDGEAEALYKEMDNTAPINYYGMTKLEGEQAVLVQKHTVLRTNIYGFNVQNKDSFGEWIYHSLIKDESLQMFTDIDFSPILVNDLTEVIEGIMERNSTGLYHTCGTGKITKYEFGIQMKETFGIKTGSICKAVSSNFPFKAKRSKHMGMDNQKLQRELGITLATPKESIDKFYQLYRKGYPKQLKKWGRVRS